MLIGGLNQRSYEPFPFQANFLFHQTNNFYLYYLVA